MRLVRGVKRLFNCVSAVLLFVACQSDLLSPPRLANGIETSRAGTAEPVAVVQLPAPTPTGDPVSIAVPPVSSVRTKPLTIWFDETSDEHKQALTLMMEEFERQQQFSVEMVLVSPSLLPELMETAVLSDTLPDVVFHPASLTMGWASRDILNGAAADAIIEQIGRDRFDSRSLELVNSGGISAAIPSDAYRQLLIYRSDWLEQSALKPPDSYETMIAFAEAVFDSAAVISGIVVPTESNLISTQQVFEHLAAANGCQIINDEGEVTILAEACQEALDFYLSIVSRFSPIGVQTDTSAQNAYLSGRTGMIVGAPDMLKKIAGLDSSAMPSCPECADDPTYLVRNSGIVTELSGGQTVQTGVDFAEIRYLGITSSAEIEAAAEFANFWFGQGYSQWLGIEPEKKVPMLRGTADQPNRFIQLWRTLPLANEQGSLTDFYGSAVVDALGASLAESERWGLDQGEGPLMARLHEELTLPVVLQEMLSGYFGSQQTLLEMHDRIIELIPGYEQ